jgi:hypothetical protein
MGVVDPGDITYSRDTVQGWLIEYYEQSEVTDLREWLVGKLGDDAELQVRRPAHDGPRTVPLIDLILDDTPSYVMDFRDAE